MAISTRLTTRQQTVYDMIRDKIVLRGYGPTVREIGEHFDIKSPNGVMCHLKALERKGLIRRSPNKSRAIELTNDADRSAKSMPMAGQVMAGSGTLTFEKAERKDLSDMFYGEDRFLLEVSGDSMVDAHITDGDMVVVQKQDHAQAGQMVVAQTTQGDVTLKYWYPEEGRIRLQPANREMEPIYVREATVIGIVVGVVRSV
ncbi:LexA repressor [Rosistilla oblonga]|uniref:LexA repressor n=1 Tax=Rosistilla oblonga TaxID=2527990 RepID=A0A518IMG0_9BACT|nr:transcriptional repressor LexA [Rosistilla oblonga]QDV10371.1 LexA repressor [Rosistilla oblonga]QDV54278.1 LexA repressor [Rosistilla oblonga]